MVIKNNICVLVVYFGVWPEYFGLFLNSCRKNKSIDFIFISDCGENELIENAGNCFYFDFSLNEVSILVSEKVGLEVNICSPYKLCDFKPAYGLIFEDYLSGYNYWGWCDIDLIFGDIKPFLECLYLYDCWHVRKNWASGSFSLMRNKSEITKLFMQSSDWKKVFLDEKHYGFDECGDLIPQIVQGKRLSDIPKDIDSFTHVVNRQFSKGEINSYFKDLAFEGVPEQLFYDGKLTDKKCNEYILFHYISAKSRWLFIFPNWNEIPTSFIINRYGFFKNEPNLPRIIKYCFNFNSFKQVSRKFIRRIKILSDHFSRKDYAFIINDFRRRLDL